MALVPSGKVSVSAVWDGAILICKKLPLAVALIFWIEAHDKCQAALGRNSKVRLVPL